MIKYKAKTVKTDDGRVFIIQDNTLQCATCIFLQPVMANKAIRDKSGNITHFYCDDFDEQHARDCTNKPSNN